mgnify:CR=1 FL=1
MKKISYLFLLINLSFIGYSQTDKEITRLVTPFKIEQVNDTIDFIVVDSMINIKKPIFLWCQGSLPVPLFCEIENYGYYFFGGGISNFDYREIVKNYHLVVISMPKTPLIVKKENLNTQYQYIPNGEKPNELSNDFIEANYLENYVNRANTVLSYLKKQDWVDTAKLIVAGHSQGAKVATKVAATNPTITHLGLFGANPFGRIDQMIRTARLDAHLGKISWEEADSTMNSYYDIYRSAHTKDSIAQNPYLKSLHSFSELFYQHWLNLNIPIYLAYGTEDRISDLCDLIPLFFIQNEKNNLKLKRYLKLEHNFFETNTDGQTDYEKPHWNEVMQDYLKTLE